MIFKLRKSFGIASHSAEVLLQTSDILQHKNNIPLKHYCYQSEELFEYRTKLFVQSFNILNNFQLYKIMRHFGKQI